jgi:hypothetical protein
MVTTTYNFPKGTIVRNLRFMLRFIGVVQASFGLLFVVAPSAAAPLLGLEPAEPGWVDWLFVMMGARFLGYAVGMFVAARDPERHVTWIDTMIGIQALDWLGTVGYLVAGDVTLRNVTTAAVLPIVFVAGLLRWHPRRSVPEAPAIA